ncbi:hypothetical protein N2382_02890 [SAR92 clade bacterium H921]|nr:hypothetical protein [SAR92 clade bacterium H921]
MSNINRRPNGEPKKPVLKRYKGRVKVQYLTPEEAREFNTRMGIPNSYLVIGPTLKGGQE